MSSPFRSEVGQLQEQLRRAEERVAAVENERATLERQLLRGRTQYGWLIVVLAAAVVSGFVGYTLAAAPAAKHQAEAAAREARDRSELAEKKAQVAACEASAKASAPPTTKRALPPVTRRRSSSSSSKTYRAARGSRCIACASPATLSAPACAHHHPEAL